MVAERTPSEGARAALAAVTGRLDEAHVAWEPLTCDPSDLRDCLRAPSPAIRHAAMVGDRVLANISTGESCCRWRSRSRGCSGARSCITRCRGMPPCERAGLWARPRDPCPLPRPQRSAVRGRERMPEGAGEARGRAPEVSPPLRDEAGQCASTEAGQHGGGRTHPQGSPGASRPGGMDSLAVHGRGQTSAPHTRGAGGSRDHCRVGAQGLQRESFSY